MPKFVCDVCASEFFNYRESKYCSRTCWKVAKSASQTIPCEVCSNTFSVPTCRATTAKYCSKSCWNKRGQIVSICKECSVEFSSFKSNDHSFCSKDCYSIWQRKNVHGEAHPSWKGGSSHYRRGSDWKEQAEKARIRDNHTCRVCGIKQCD